MKTNLPTLFFLFLTASAFGQVETPSSETEVILNPGDTQEDVVIQRYLNDTLASVTPVWKDPLWEGRVGIGLSGINGVQSGGIHLELEGSSVVNDHLALDLRLSGIVNQGDSEGGGEEIVLEVEGFTSWTVEAGASLLLGDNVKKTVKPISWKFRTPFGVRYEEHAHTISRARHRHFLRAGWHQYGGLPLGATSSFVDTSNRQVRWNTFHVGSIALGYTYRMDRLLRVSEGELFSGKNLSRSRIIYADVLLSVQQNGTGQILELQNDEYVEVGPLEETDLRFTPIGIRAGYRGTYLMGKGNWGFYHKYELGWRPAYIGSEEELSNVNSSSNFYISVSAGVQF